MIGGPTAWWRLGKARQRLRRGKEASSRRQQLSATSLLPSHHTHTHQGLGGDYLSTSAGQRDRMLQSTERLQKTTERLQLGKQQLAETEVRWGLEVPGRPRKPP